VPRALLVAELDKVEHDYATPERLERCWQYMTKRLNVQASQMLNHLFTEFRALEALRDLSGQVSLKLFLERLEEGHFGNAPFIGHLGNTPFVDLMSTLADGKVAERRALAKAFGSGVAQLRAGRPRAEREDRAVLREAEDWLREHLRPLEASLRAMCRNDESALLREVLATIPGLKDKDGEAQRIRRIREQRRWEPAELRDEVVGTYLRARGATHFGRDTVRRLIRAVKPR